MLQETTREPQMGLAFEKVWAMFQETDKKISRLGDRLGELIEHLMSANIVEKFNKLGYAFGRANPNARFFSPRNELIAEVDILLENGDVALAVEIKADDQRYCRPRGPDAAAAALCG
jgi:hypothetical protein